MKSLVGTKQKIYIPYELQFVNRVVREDYQGPYIQYKGDKWPVRYQIGCLGQKIGLEALYYERR